MRVRGIVVLAVAFCVTRVSGDTVSSASLRVTAQPRSPTVLLSQRVGPSTQAGDVALDVVVKNVSAKKQSFLTTTCGWWGDWSTDNPLVQVHPVACAKNAPLIVNLAPGQTFTRELPLVVKSRKKSGDIVFKVAVHAPDGAALSVGDLVSLMNSPSKKPSRPADVQKTAMYWSEPVLVALHKP